MHEGSREVRMVVGPFLGAFIRSALGLWFVMALDFGPEFGFGFDFGFRAG